MRPLPVALLSAFFGSAALGDTAPADPMPQAIELRTHLRLIASVEAIGRTLTPFETDGCSGGLSIAWVTFAATFPDFAEAHRDRPPWEACCVTHDRAYHHAAGAETATKSIAARLAADESLRLCVIATGEERTPQVARLYGLRAETVRSAYAAVATAMFRAVRLGGLPCSGLSWRWGYGLPACQ